MKQHNLINTLISKLIENDLIDASFLVGSYARQTEDENSNIDLYIVLKNQKYEDYISIIPSILDSLNKIVYLKTKSQNNYILCYDVIYIDNIRLNLHNILVEDINPNMFNNDILKLYDPNNLLTNLMNYNLEFSEKEIGEIIESFSLSAFEFSRVYVRHDLAIMIEKVSDCFDSFSYIIRYFDKLETSKLGKKEILADLTQEHRYKYVQVIKLFKVDTLKECLLLMMDLVKDLSSQMTLNVAQYYDYDLMMHVYKRIKLL